MMIKTALPYETAQAVIYGRREVSCMLKRPLPIGIEFYKDMIKKSYYYIDKTLMIKDILEEKR